MNNSHIPYLSYLPNYHPRCIWILQIIIKIPRNGLPRFIIHCKFLKLKISADFRGPFLVELGGFFSCLLRFLCSALIARNRAVLASSKWCCFFCVCSKQTDAALEGQGAKKHSIVASRCLALWACACSCSLEWLGGQKAAWATVHLMEEILHWLKYMKPYEHGIIIPYIDLWRLLYIPSISINSISPTWKNSLELSNSFLHQLKCRVLDTWNFCGSH